MYTTHRLRLLMAIVTAILLVALAAGCSGTGDPPDPGPEAAQEYILEYIDALNASDAIRVRELVGEHTGAQDIQDRLNLFGGRGLIDVEITIAPQDFIYCYRFWLSARTADGTEVEMYQVVVFENNTWTMDGLHHPPFPEK